MFALGTRDIDRTIGSLRLRGVSVQDPTIGSRTADSDKGGYSWRSAAVDSTLTPGSATFLIQHDQTIAKRYQQPANPTQHPNGALRVAQLTLAVEDARAAAARWQQLFQGACRARVCRQTRARRRQTCRRPARQLRYRIRLAPRPRTYT